LFDLKSGQFRVSSRNNDKNSTVTLFAVGDIVLDLGVKVSILNHSPIFPFEKIIFLLHTGDLVFGNLESSLSDQQITSNLRKRIHFSGITDGVMGLKYAGFNILNLANNHIMDFGKGAMLDTFRILKENNIKYIGTGNNLNEARKPVIFNIKGISVGFLGYASPDCETNAELNKAGTAPSKIDLMIEDVSKLKNEVDIVIVSIHRGLEFVYYPLPEHQRECRRLIEEGVDVILCHHPHVPQGIEIYRGGVIAYSLGEFISDFEPPLTEYENTLFLRTRYIYIFRNFTFIAERIH